MQEREFPQVSFLVVIRARLKGAGLRWKKASRIMAQARLP
jgi:hypothetical protein